MGESEDSEGNEEKLEERSDHTNPWRPLVGIHRLRGSIPRRRKGRRRRRRRRRRRGRRRREAGEFERGGRGVAGTGEDGRGTEGGGQGGEEGVGFKVVR